MIITALGYLFLFLSGLAICLFCWLSYSCLRGGARPQKPAAEQLLEHAAENITPPMSAGSG